MVRTHTTPRPGPVAFARVALLLAFAAAAPAPGHASTNDTCLRCHGMATLARRAETGEVQRLAVDPKEYAHGEHRRLQCTSCHSAEYQRFPHTVRGEELRCTSCHQAKGPELARASFAHIAAEFSQSVHARRHPDAFTCFRCHDPHSFRRWDDVSRQSVEQQNGVCLACHASEARFTPIAGRPLPDIQRAHAWLPHQELHRRHVRCLDCHSGYQAPARSHLILPAKQAVRDCVACHSRDSVLRLKLYRHQRGEDAARLGFVNAAIVNDAYVIGATRNRLVDAAGALLLLSTVLGVATHGGLRLRAGRRRARGRGGVPASRGREAQP